MLEHAKNLEFEKAARIRDQLAALREQAFGASVADNVVALPPAAAGSALEAELIGLISTELLGFRYT